MSVSFRSEFFSWKKHLCTYKSVISKFIIKLQDFILKLNKFISIYRSANSKTDELSQNLIFLQSFADVTVILATSCTYIANSLCIIKISSLSYNYNKHRIAQCGFMADHNSAATPIHTPAQIDCAAPTHNTNTSNHQNNRHLYKSMSTCEDLTHTSFVYS